MVRYADGSQGRGHLFILWGGAVGRSRQGRLTAIDWSYEREIVIFPNIIDARRVLKKLQIKAL